MTKWTWAVVLHKQMPDSKHEIMIKAERVEKIDDHKIQVDNAVITFDEYVDAVEPFEGG